ncbi:uncharacterized protein MONBRDRAFT_23322 [Monosiga brevicollis MX1]|uniref:Co-chaperone HscB C-terminal oligomerisation domain-containing protein n=1 Tax=Monosiga brevicollis TaxID=81824 RepID=A9UT18_MONBE|nr:uncharacterized protein MONBRDRAFT_23322 [Monosiga brevicollis MX1]EDQ91166.1 predicted protein [Monosiga brevicollis MX1]|eukprot:XP_001743588.1 hypothetical protein [Monosiga brevicollis MX1]
MATSKALGLQRVCAQRFLALAARRVTPAVATAASTSLVFQLRSSSQHSGALRDFLQTLETPSNPDTDPFAPGRSATQSPAAPVPSVFDPFAELDLPAQFHLEPSDVQRRQRELLRAHHPDRFGHDQRAMETAIARTAAINRAGTVLLDPIERALALLRLAGHGIAEDTPATEINSSAEFLMEMMERHEVRETGTDEQRQQLASQVEEECAAIEADLEQAFATADYATARDGTLRLKYLINFLNSVQESTKWLGRQKLPINSAKDDARQQNQTCAPQTFTVSLAQPTQDGSKPQHPSVTQSHESKLTEHQTKKKKLIVGHGSSPQGSHDSADGDDRAPQALAHALDMKKTPHPHRM